MPVIHHTRSGAGSLALVFIHAFGCARSDGDAQVAELSANYETVAVDLGGHGTTPARPEHIRVETHAQDVVELMSELDLEACAIVGNSLGCRIALEVASRAPTRTRAAVRVPLLAIQSTRINDDGERISLSPGETSLYLELLKANVPDVAVNIIAGSGHYPQIEQAQATNVALLAIG